MAQSKNLFNLSLRSYCKQESRCLYTVSAPKIDHRKTLHACQCIFYTCPRLQTRLGAPGRAPGLPPPCCGWRCWRAARRCCRATWRGARCTPSSGTATAWASPSTREYSYMFPRCSKYPILLIYLMFTIILYNKRFKN